MDKQKLLAWLEEQINNAVDNIVTFDRFDRDNKLEAEYWEGIFRGLVVVFEAVESGRFDATK